MKTLKTIGGILVDALIIVVFVVSLLLVIANLGVDRRSGEQPNVFGYVMNTVQSDSMAETFHKGALVIGKIPDENTEIVVGESIVTFRQQQDDVEFNNTHRVVGSMDEAGVTRYQTQGDNREICPTPDREWKTRRDITSVYVCHLPLLGGLIDFLKTPVGFVILLVLPMLGFIAWQIYKLINIYLAAKREELAAEAAAGVPDEAKDAIIREYLKQMQEKESSTEEDQKKDGE